MNPVQKPADLQKYRVNRSGQFEVIKQTLYDFQQYALAGALQFNFFQAPIGSGGKTKADTNMTLQSQLPAGQAFLASSIECYFLPGLFPSLAPAAETIDTFTNDMWEVLSGNSFTELNIGSKNYLTESMLMRFPPKCRMDGWAGMSSSTTAGANGFVKTVYASAAGRPYNLDPFLLLESSQNFSLQLNFPAVVAISANARIGFVIDGWLIRNSQ